MPAYRQRSFDGSALAVGRGPPEARTTDEHQGKGRMMATKYYVSLFIQVPDEGETEAWQVEQALRDAAEEHLWQIVSLTLANDETGGAGR
jgi:hypothetical protein